MRKNKRINKKIHKLAQGECRICGENDYATLDVHRIIEGKNGGKYDLMNTVVLCANCHRKVHDKQLEIDKYYLCSNGKHMLRVLVDGLEKFI